jgi:hypothetical protein
VAVPVPTVSASAKVRVAPQRRQVGPQRGKLPF